MRRLILGPLLLAAAGCNTMSYSEMRGATADKPFFTTENPAVSTDAWPDQGLATIQRSTNTHLPHITLPADWDYQVTYLLEHGTPFFTYGTGNNGAVNTRTWQPPYEIREVQVRGYKRGLMWWLQHGNLRRSCTTFEVFVRDPANGWRKVDRRLARAAVHDDWWDYLLPLDDTHRETDNLHPQPVPNPRPNSSGNNTGSAPNLPRTNNAHLAHNH